MKNRDTEILAQEIVNAKHDDATLKSLRDAFSTCPADDTDTLSAIKTAVYSRSVDVTRKVLDDDQAS